MYLFLSTYSQYTTSVRVHVILLELSEKWVAQRKNYVYMPCLLLHLVYIYIYNIAAGQSD